MPATCLSVQITFQSPGISSKDALREIKQPPGTHTLNVWQRGDALAWEPMGREGLVRQRVGVGEAVPPEAGQ